MSLGAQFDRIAARRFSPYQSVWRRTVAYGRVSVNTSPHGNHAPRPRAQLDRDAWITEAIEVLAAEGVAGLRVEVLAKRLGVTKGSFYWHFKDRQDLLNEALKVWRDGRIRDIAKQTRVAPGEEARQILHLIEVYSASRNRKGMLIELAVRDWAKRDAAVATIVSEVDAFRFKCARSFSSVVACRSERRRAEACSLCLCLRTIADGGRSVRSGCRNAASGHHGDDRRPHLGGPQRPCLIHARPGITRSAFAPVKRTTSGVSQLRRRASSDAKRGTLRGSLRCPRAHSGPCPVHRSRAPAPLQATRLQACESAVSLRSSSCRQSQGRSRAR